MQSQRLSLVPRHLAVFALASAIAIPVWAQQSQPSDESSQQSQPAAGRALRADEEKKDDHVVDSFEPTYLFDAMKEKRQLKHLLVRSHTHLAASCH